MALFPAPGAGPPGEDSTVNEDSLLLEGSPDVQWTVGKTVRRWTDVAVYSWDTRLALKMLISSQLLFPAVVL